MHNPIYNLTDLIGIIEKTYKDFLGGFNFWFKSEISKITLIKGNYYLDLIEYDANGIVKAKFRGIIFGTSVVDNFIKKSKINNLEQIKKYKILMHGRFNFHQDYGFSIIINEISHEYFLGQMVNNIEKIKSQLINEGVFHLNKSLKPNLPPFNVAIISTKDSAGYGDFVSILNNSNYICNYELYESAIHGNEAIQQVYDALLKISNDISHGKELDFIIITRGGGGSGGIMWQNDYNIARTICKLKVPVIIAVGHTQDKSILDEVCYYAAKTPSDAAYFIINLYEFYKNTIIENINSINFQVKYKLSKYLDTIQLYYENIIVSGNGKLNNYNQNIELFYSNIKSLGPDKLVDRGYALLYTVDGKFINKDKLEKLKQGDKFNLKIYDKHITVTINNIGNNLQN